MYFIYKLIRINNIININMWLKRQNINTYLNKIKSKQNKVFPTVHNITYFEVKNSSLL